MVQIYEEYWKLTLAWTDFNSKHFIDALRGTVEFIDEHKNQEYSEEIYSSLQDKISKLVGLVGTSLRKAINQLVKMGFVNYHLESYHPLAKEYIKDSLSDKERQMILSKVMYSNSSFNRSVTEQSFKREINFFVKTLEKCGSLDSKYMRALISINIDDYPQGYIEKEQLEQLLETKEIQEFIGRKYNQKGYFINVLKKLDGIVYKTGKFYLEKDISNVNEDCSTERETTGRDPYLQKIYKKQLQNESMSIFGKIKCMVENLEYPVLIASHIKPFRDSNEDEAYDPNNGLLLSKNVDSLFDLNYISFDDNGKIIFYSRVSDDIKNFLNSYRIDKRFLNPKRLAYLAYHRHLCEIKN